MGVPKVSRAVSFRRAYRAGAVLERVYRVLAFSGEPPMTRFLAAQLAHSHHFNISRAREDLGYRPRVGVEEGLDRLLKT
jgi:nucleoside-diphosphate-sugar epimerase